MPKICRDDGEAVCGGAGRRLERIEIAGAVTAEDHRLRVSILDRETKIIKFNVDRIITSEGTNKN